MNFLYPFAFSGLITVPLVIFIYFFHKRFKPKIISAVFLFPKQNVVTGSGRKFSNIIKNILLFLEILMFIILVLAAAGPYCSSMRNANNLTFVLDSSASMGVPDEQGKTPKDRAVEYMRALIKDYEPYNIELILSGFNPRPVSSGIRSESEFLNSISDWNTDNIYHSLVPSVETAGQITGEDGKIIVITDSVIEEYTGDNISVFAFGKPLSNTGITQAVRKPEYSGINETVFIIIRNFDSSEKQVKVNLYEEEDLIMQTDIILEAEGKETPVLFEIEKTDKNIRVVIDSDDTMSIDNSVYLVPEENSKLPVNLIMDDPELEKAVIKILDVFKSRIHYTNEDPLLTITDRNIESMLPEDREDLRETIWYLEFKNISENNFYGPFIVDKSHAFTRELMLEGVRWPAALNMNEGYPVISSGNTFLLSEKNQGNMVRHFIMNIHLNSSNIDETLNWPIFFSNLILSRADELSGIKSRNNIICDTVPVKYYNTESIKIISSDDEITEIVRQGNIFPVSSDKPGIYKIITDNEDEYRISFVFLSDEESDLRNLGNYIPEIDIEKAGFEISEQIGWLLLILVLMIFILHSYIQKREG